ncbi:MAG: ATP-dependent zinc metalloprotease FtsH [Patescibacteria group bacterium]
MKPLSKNILIGVLALLALGLVFSTVNVGAKKPDVIDTSALIEKVESGSVKSIVVEGDSLTVIATDDTTYTAKKEPEQSLTEMLTNRGVTTEQLNAVHIEVKEPSAAAALFTNFLPTLLFVVVFGALLWFFMRQMQGANSKAMMFGQANIKETTNKKNRVTFADVAGATEAKEELSEVVEFLKTPKKFADLGAKIPKGVLLMGPPGTGKTLIARAVSGEANVPFFHISGSEFVEMFVGVGASRVRDLFTRAKKAAPCIVFIDEIDAVGRQRGAGLGGGHDEREQTLNQILVEMDGFEPNIGVIVIAATNRPDVLDPALLRPGRFDRRVVIDRPDLVEREAILNIHAVGKPVNADVDLHRIAERTIGMSGADLMNIMNEAAILAARKNQKETTQKELLDAIEKVMIGPERKSHILSQDERLVTAYHEAGHAIVGHLLPFCDDVHKVSIIARGRAAGYTMSIPDEDRKMHSKREFIDDLAMTLGGYVAEQEIFGDLTTGASNDLQKATALARELVTQFGMSSTLGPRTYGDREDGGYIMGRQAQEHRDYSEKIAEQIDTEINAFLQGALATAQRIIKEQRPRMDLVVKELLEKETIEKEAFEALIGPTQKRPKVEIQKA